MNLNITLAPSFAKAFHTSPSHSKLIVSFPNAGNSREHKRSRITGKHTLRSCQSGEETNQKTADSIPCESSITEINTFADDLNPSAMWITKDGAKSSACGNEDYGIDRGHE